MKKKKKIAVLLFIVFVGIQFIPTNHNESNLEYPSDFMQVFDVPQNIQDKLIASCYDCHSNNTKYPWYNKIQPLSWILEGHIEEGKNELNFNEFGNYSSRRQKSKITSIVRQIEGDKMPLSSYVFIHKEAKINETEKKEILQWLTKLKNNEQTKTN